MERFVFEFYKVHVNDTAYHTRVCLTCYYPFHFQVTGNQHGHVCY